MDEEIEQSHYERMLKKEKTPYKMDVIDYIIVGMIVSMSAILTYMYFYAK